ncbi:chloramphenicol phosphotransferase-like protein [Erythrobacter sp. NAP1]|uniref:phosphotransferase-like protein n=1 Tax=Erythrobacter sp. NAP1 TaxID=237727 RepID=UPI0000686AFB|nr:chloramphenicol phosphotransferase-like protein [Erythrobacter sp. NAP1]EAQ29925.1 chloramphenicol phosphotransferase-like protein [Erythrobacter sp. NAP1]
MARIIILNGVSSAGKSSLARAIQGKADRTFLHIEMDAFISFLPNGHEFRPEWFEVQKIPGERSPLPRIINGPRGEALLSVMRQFVFNAADRRLDMIVDEVCHAREVRDYRDGLVNHDLTVVKVHAPLDVVAAREKARGNRLIGLGQEQSTHLHDGIDYDEVIDTSSGSARELAAQLLSRIAT